VVCETLLIIDQPSLVQGCLVSLRNSILWFIRFNIIEFSLVDKLYMLCRGRIVSAHLSVNSFTDLASFDG